MRVEHTSHFRDVIILAEDHNAVSVSIQNYYTFCNFPNAVDANKFLSAITKAGMSNGFGVNPDRHPGKFWEVAVTHPR